MQQKFAVLNPNTGSYELADSRDAALAKAAQMAVSFYLSHTHEQPFASVAIDDSGAETWTSLNGDPVLSPAQIYEQSELMKAQIQSFIDAQAMPVTKLGD